MTELETLAATLEIHALKARYFRTLDEKDWTAHEAVFAPDLVADFRASAGGWEESLLTHGASAYVAKLAASLEDVTTVHHGHMPEITIDCDDAASGIWAMEDKLWVGPASSLPFAWMHGYGHYHERYVRLNGAWQIKETRLSRLRTDVG